MSGHVNAAPLDKKFLTTGVKVLIAIFGVGMAFGLYRFIFGLGSMIWIILNLYMVLDATRMYKSIKPALLVPLVMPAQIFGYGLGFIYNYIRRVWFGKGEKVGFQKNYYH